MFGFFRNLFKRDTEKNSSNNSKYLSCRYLQGGITFMHDAVRTCCSNKQGINFLLDYKGEKINWNKIEKQRKQAILNCKKGILPLNCVGCVELENKVWDENPLIDDLYFNYWSHCNCGCVYCVVGAKGKYLQTEKTSSDYYSVLSHIKELYKKGRISKNAHVEFVGGEIAILDEADELVNLCLANGVGRMSFHSSCISYSNAIEKAFKSEYEVDLDFSLDCGSRELYKKIKRVDAFDTVVENVKKYISISEKAKNSIIAKYIIIDGLNDSVEEVDKWLNLVNSIGIKNAKIDINFKRFFSEFNHSNPVVPPHYYDIYNHYKKLIEEFGIKNHCYEFSKKVFETGGIPKDY